LPVVTATALRLLHLTDTHLFAGAGMRLRGVDTDRSLAAVLDHAGRHREQPQAILATGDLSQDETAGSYQVFRTRLTATGKPVWCVPGNHDAPSLLTPGLAADGFQAGGSAGRGNWQVILLDSFVAGDHGGRLSAGELASLRRELAAARDRHVLLAVHHHVLPVGSRWLDDLGLRNADEFLALVDTSPQVRAVVCGHVHQASDQSRHGVRYMSTPSTCFQFLPGVEDFAIDVRPPGYRWLDLMPDGSIATEVVWIDPPH
jgi:Icc protein